MKTDKFRKSRKGCVITPRWGRWSSSRDQRGGVLLLTPFAIVVLLMLFGLAYDGHRILSERIEQDRLARTIGLATVKAFDRASCHFDFDNKNKKRVEYALKAALGVVDVDGSDLIQVNVTMPSAYPISVEVNDVTGSSRATAKVRLGSIANPKVPSPQLGELRPCFVIPPPPSPLLQGADLWNGNTELTGGILNSAPGLTVGTYVQAPQFFDWYRYIYNHPDIIAAGIDTEAEAKRHFGIFGSGEGRRSVSPVLSSPHRFIGAEVTMSGLSSRSRIPMFAKIFGVNSLSRSETKVLVVHDTESDSFDRSESASDLWLSKINNSNSVYQKAREFGDQDAVADVDDGMRGVATREVANSPGEIYTSVVVGDRIYLAKYLPNGSRDWIREVGGPIVPMVTSSSSNSGLTWPWVPVAVGSDGVYVGGYHSQNGDYDGLLVKFSFDGLELWRHEVISPSVNSARSGSDQVLSIAVEKDPSGGPDGIYIAGGTSGNMSQNPKLTADWDGFIRKVSGGNGEILWTVQDISPGLGDYRSLTVYGDGESARLAAVGVVYSENLSDSSAIFTLMNGIDGSNKQLYTLSEFERSVGKSVTVSGHGFFTVGKFQDSAGSKCFVKKYFSNGEASWSKTFGNGQTTCEQVTVDREGYLILAGFGGGSLGGASSAGLDDAFIAKIDPFTPPNSSTSSGDVVWLTQWGDERRNLVSGIATLGGSVYVTGANGGKFIGTSTAEALNSFDGFLRQIPLETRLYNVSAFRHNPTGVFYQALSNPTNDPWFDPITNAVVPKGYRAVDDSVVGLAARDTNHGLGEIYAIVLSNRQLELVKYLSDGTKLWSKPAIAPTIPMNSLGEGGWGSSPVWPFFPVAIGSDGVYVGGFTVQGPGDLNGIVAKFTFDGIELWRHVVDGTPIATANLWRPDGGAQVLAIAVREKVGEEDEVYIAGGSSSQLTPVEKSSDDWDGFVRRIRGLDGSVVWSQQDVSPGPSDFRAIALGKGDDDGVYVGGYLGDESSNVSGSVWKRLSPDGAVSRTWVSTNSSVVNFISTSSSGITVGGHEVRSDGIGSGCWASRFSYDGSLLWNTHFGPKNGATMCNHGVVDEAESLHAVGYTFGGVAGENGLGAEDVLLASIDKFGNEHSLATWGDSNRNMAASITFLRGSVFVGGTNGSTGSLVESKSTFDGFIRKVPISREFHLVDLKKPMPTCGDDCRLMLYTPTPTPAPEWKAEPWGACSESWDFSQSQCEDVTVFAPALSNIWRNAHTSRSRSWGSSINIPASFTFPSGFNWGDYIYRNPDLFPAGIDTPIEARRHWFKYGQHSGRGYRKNCGGVNVHGIGSRTSILCSSTRTRQVSCMSWDGLQLGDASCSKDKPASSEQCSCPNSKVESCTLPVCD